MLSLVRSDCLYTKCYCEENVWKLCEKLSHDSAFNDFESFVVFVSNEDQTVPLWHQRSGTAEQDGLVVWDYHVFLIVASSPRVAYVFDVDSTLPFPVPFGEYFDNAIKTDDCIKDPSYNRKFRLIAAKDYLRNFCSDRSHMLNPDGTWKQPPPVWPAIRPEGLESNLHEFWTMHKPVPVDAISEVFSTEELFQRFSGRKTNSEQALIVDILSA